MYRFILIALVLFLFMSCYNKDLGEPIKPNHRSEEELINDVLKYYKYYKKRYIKESNGNTPGGGYYVLAESTGGVPQDWLDQGIGAKSNSEAIGYGMIISSLVGDKEVFDGLYNFYNQYPSSNNPDLMSWVIPEDEDQSLSKTGSASDGDMDIAYSLYLAHKRWGSNGDVNYLNESLDVIKACEVLLIGDNNALLMGDWVKSSEEEKYKTATRSSDWFPGHFKLFEHLTGNSKWSDVTNTIYKEIIPKVAHDDTGLVPDFIKGDFTIPRKKFLETPYDGFYNWNACRYPWRQSIGYGHLDNIKHKKAIKKQMMKLADFTIEEIEGYKDFYKIHSGYDLLGYPIPNRYFTSTAFSSPLINTFTVDEKYQEFLNIGWDFMRGKRQVYFGDSITLLNMLYISGIWYDPVTEEPMDIKWDEITEISLDQNKLVDILNNDSWLNDVYKENEDDKADAEFSISDVITVDVKNYGDVPYSVALYNFPMKIQKGNYYQIDLKIKSSIERDIFVFLGMSKPPWAYYGGDYLSLKADNKWHDYRIIVEMLDKTDKKGELGIQFGKMQDGYNSADGVFQLKDITVKEYQK